MLSRSTLTRSALVALVLVALVALADGMARAQLERAVGGFTGAQPRVAVQMAGAVD